MFRNIRDIIRMTRTYLYSIIVGLLLFMVVYYYNRKSVLEIFNEDKNQVEEYFKDSNNSSENSEVIIDIPKRQYLHYYLNTSNPNPEYNSDEISYDSSTQRWKNHIKDVEPFILISSDNGSNIPVSMEATKGLPIKNIKLSGPPSDSLTKYISASNYNLGSFTFSFYVKFNSIDFSTRDRYNILNVYLEHPNQLIVAMEKLDNDNVNIIVTVGETNYTIKIAKTTFLTGSNLLLTVSFNKDTNKLGVYIGDIDYITPNTTQVTSTDSLIVGNSNIIINKDSDWNVNLYAFMYFSTSMTIDDHKELNSYLTRQHSGIINEINRSTLQITEYKNKLNEIKTELDKSVNNMNKCNLLKEELEKLKKLYEKDKPKLDWKVYLENGGYNVKATDIEKCNILKVDTILQKHKQEKEVKTVADNISKNETPVVNKENKDTTVQEVNTKPKERFGITFNPDDKPAKLITNFKDSVMNYFAK
jgi:hypothetical protein